MHRFLLMFSLGAVSLIHAESMEEVVVIGARTEQSREDLLSSSSLIQQEDIRLFQMNDMTSVLSRIPGMSLATSGSMGSQTSLLLRGTNANQTLVMIDGQRMNAATSGTSSIQFIEPEQIERIEVVKGGMAVLYGADAIGGVINIITRTPDMFDNLFLSAGAGSYGTQKTTGAIVDHLTDSTQVQLSLSYVTSHGFDSTEYKAYGSDDKDAYSNLGGIASVTQTLGESVMATLGYIRNEGDTDYDQLSGFYGFSQPYKHFLLQSYQLVFDFNPEGIWNSRLALGQLSDRGEEKDHITPGQPYSVFETQRTNATWQHDLTWADEQITTLGVDYYKDSVKNSRTTDGAEYEGNERDNWGVFLQQQSAVGWMDFQVALRHDENQDYGANTTGDIAFGFNLTTAKIFTTYAEGFRAPTFNDLYYPNYNSPNLKPEKSRQYEAGIRGLGNQWNWQINGYLTRLRDMIIPSPTSTTQSKAENIGHSDIKGAEASLGFSQWDLDFMAWYAYVYAKDKDNDRLLPYRPKHTGHLDVVKNFDRWHAGMSVHARTGSPYYDYMDNTWRIPGFTTVDIFAATEVTTHLTLKLKITNVFDRDYAMNLYAVDGGVEQYNTAGIAGFFSFVYNLDF